MEKNKKKQLMVGVIAIVLLIVATVGVTYAFFNYTRTGTANTVSTGRIAFNSSQDGRINLTNIFPIDPTETGIMDDASKVGTVAITVTGDTTYSKGVEYLVSATNVTNTVGTGANQKTIPISISATASGSLGTSNDNYFEDRDTATTHIYKVLAKDTISNNDQLMVGYIANNAAGINGTITIKAYIDKNNIAITDTYDGTESDNNGTTSTWVNGREIFTTEEWNSLQGNGVSFQIKVEAQEGRWVEEVLSVNAMNTFPTIITDQKANIKEVYFNKMSANAMQNAYDAATIKADITYNNEGKVLAWLEEDSEDNTKYIMYVASDGITYLTNGDMLFIDFSNVSKIEFNNINTNRVTGMNRMFSDCSKLNSLDLRMYNTENVTGMVGMFDNCSNLVTLEISSFDISKVRDFNSMFRNCSNLSTIDISNFDTRYANNTNSAAMTNVFYGCTSLEKIYVSELWDASNQYSGMPIFGNNTSLVGQAPNTTYAFNSSEAVDKTYAVIATDTTPGYLTDVSLKPTT